MAYLNQRLSTCVTQGFSGGPEWSTLVVPLDNGREQRNAQWLYPKHKYTADYQNFDKTDRDEILSAFHAARGMLHVFRFKDWADFEMVDQPLSPAIGTVTPVQLTKTYTFGGQSSTRLIQAPLTMVITRNGTPVTGTMDAGTGLFTPAANWIAGTYLANGEFDLWVRFDDDYNAFTATTKDFWSSNVTLIEVRR